MEAVLVKMAGPWRRFDSQKTSRPVWLDRDRVLHDFGRKGEGRLRLKRLSDGSQTQGRHGLPTRLSLSALLVLTLLTGCVTGNMFSASSSVPPAVRQEWIYRFLSPTDEQKVRRALDDALLPADAKDRLRAVLGRIDQGWIPDGMSQSQIMDNAFCAWTAARTRSLLLGLSGDSVIADGLVGDAWTFQLSIPEHGGSVVWKRGDGNLDASLLAPGDLIGVYYTNSLYNARIETPEASARWPLTFTHIIYVAFTFDDDALVIHDFRAPWATGPRPWPVRIELLSKVRERFAGQFEPMIVMRPRSSLAPAALED